eukprot:403337244
MGSLQLNLPTSSRNKINSQNLINQSKTIQCASTKQSNDFDLNRRFEVETNDQEEIENNNFQEYLSSHRQSLNHLQSQQEDYESINHRDTLLSNQLFKIKNIDQIQEPHHQRIQTKSTNFDDEIIPQEKLQNLYLDDQQYVSVQKIDPSLKSLAQNKSQTNLGTHYRCFQHNSSTTQNQQHVQITSIQSQKSLSKNKSMLEGGENGVFAKKKLSIKITGVTNAQIQQFKSPVPKLLNKKTSRQSLNLDERNQMKKQSSMISFNSNKNMNHNIDENFRLSLRKENEKKWSKLQKQKSCVDFNNYQYEKFKKKWDIEDQQVQNQQLQEKTNPEQQSLKELIQSINHSFDNEAKNQKVENNYKLFQQDLSPIGHNLTRQHKNQSSSMISQGPINFQYSKPQTPLVDRSFLNNHKRNQQSTNSILLDNCSPLKDQKSIMSRNITYGGNPITTKSINLYDMKTPLDNSINMTQYSDAEFNCLLQKQLKTCMSVSEFKNLKFQSDNCYKFLKKSIVSQTEIAYDFFKASDYLKQFCHSSLFFLSFYKDLELLLSDNSKLMYLHKEILLIMKKYSLNQLDLDFEDLNRKQIDYQRKQYRQQEDIDEIAAYYRYAKVNRIEIEKSQYQQIQQELQELRESFAKVSQKLKIKNRNEDFSSSRIQNYKQGKGKQVGLTLIQQKQQFGQALAAGGSKGLSQMNKMIEQLKVEVKKRNQLIEQLDEKIKSMEKQSQISGDETRDREKQMKCVIQELTTKFKKLKEEKDNLKNLLSTSHNVDMSQYKQLLIEKGALVEKLQIKEQVQSQLIEVMNKDEKFQNLRKTFGDLSNILVSNKNQKVEMSFAQQEFFKMIISEGLRNEVKEINQAKQNAQELGLGLLQDLNECVSLLFKSGGFEEISDQMNFKLKNHHQRFSEIVSHITYFIYLYFQFGFYPNLYHDNSVSATRINNFTENSQRKQPKYQLTDRLTSLDNQKPQAYSITRRIDLSQRANIHTSPSSKLLAAQQIHCQTPNSNLTNQNQLNLKRQNSQYYHQSDIKLDKNLLFNEPKNLTNTDLNLCNLFNKDTKEYSQNLSANQQRQHVNINEFDISPISPEFQILQLQNQRVNMHSTLSQDSRFKTSMSNGKCGKIGFTKRELKQKLNILRKENKELRQIIDNQTLNIQSQTSKNDLNQNQSQRLVNKNQMQYGDVDYIKSLHLMASMIEELKIDSDKNKHQQLLEINRN